MRKQVYGRKFKRDTNERKALFNSLISAMILKGKIETTEQKAKSIKSDLEKMVTKAKKGNGARRLLSSQLRPFEVEKLMTQIGPGFKNRAGGYTRITRLGRRFNDDASMVMMQWSEMEKVELPAKPKPVKKSTRVVKKASTTRKTAVKKPTTRKTTRRSK